MELHPDSRGPAVGKCPACECERRWHYSQASHRPDEAPDAVAHFYLCPCRTWVLLVFADARQEWRRPPSGRWDVAL